MHHSRWRVFPLLLVTLALAPFLPVAAGAYPAAPDLGPGPGRMAEGEVGLPGPEPETSHPVSAVNTFTGNLTLSQSPVSYECAAGGLR